MHRAATSSYSGCPRNRQINNLPACLGCLRGGCGPDVQEILPSLALLLLRHQFLGRASGSGCTIKLEESGQTASQIRISSGFSAWAELQIVAMLGLRSPLSVSLCKE